MKPIIVPDNLEKSELTDFLQKNERELIAQKKVLKCYSDSFSYMSVAKTEAKKEQADENLTELPLEIVLNSCGIMDSHRDVHIPGLWKKTLKENKYFLHLESHHKEWDKVISDVEKVYTANIKLSDLGLKGNGDIECLIMKALAKKEYNPLMFEKYRQNKVKQHSVGMRYVKIVLCINDESAGANYEAWEKYYPYIINNEEADRYGYFYGVTEAKLLEGSAVLFGSNPYTPTLSNKKEPEKSTQTEPHKALKREQLKKLLTF